MLFRKCMSQTIMAQRDLFLEQCEEYTLCHGAQIRKEKYQEDLAKKLKAVCANQWWRSLVEPVEQRVKSTSKTVFAGPEQARRFQEDQLNLDQQQLDDILEMEKRNDGLFVPTLEKFISNSARIACVQAIWEGHNSYISHQGQVMDMFFTSRPLINKSSATILLRLITMMPQTNESIEVLQESLVSYAGLVGLGSLSIREIEWKWSYRMLEVLRNLKRVHSLESPSLKFIFGNTIKEHGYKYCCGNPGIMNQLSYWRAAEEEREARAIAPESMTSVRDYLGNQRALLRKEMTVKLQLQHQDDSELTGSERGDQQKASTAPR